MLNSISTDPTVQVAFIVTIALILIVFRLVRSENNRAAALGIERLDKEFHSLNGRIFRLEQKQPTER